jgi:hypothetical protein
MKNFINKLELAFDKQLADKTNYGRNQVKELFLRACIEVLAETDVHVKTAKQIMENSYYGKTIHEYIQKAGRANRLSEIPSKEERTTVILHHNSDVVTVDFTDPATEEIIRVDLYKRPDCKSWALDFHSLTMDRHVVMGETSIVEPTTEDLIQLYQFYKNDKYNLNNV